MNETTMTPAGPYCELSGFPDCPNPRKALGALFRACAGDPEQKECLALLMESGFLPLPGQKEESLFDRMKHLLNGSNDIDQEEAFRLVLEHKQEEREREEALAEVLRQ